MMDKSDFFKAIECNDKEGVLAGLRLGFDADSKNDQNDTALDVALKAGHDDIAEILLSTELKIVTESISVDVPKQDVSVEPIAIVGMSCRFAGHADNIENFWQSLLDKSGVTSVAPSSRFVRKADYREASKFPASFLRDDLGLFDAEFFRIGSDEASLMDPQQRILLEQTYHAFEQGGFDMHALNGKQVGVYVGQMTHDYSDMMRADSDDGNPRFATGNIDSVLSGRIAYLFNFLGEALTLNTACSSSLAGIHIASNSLRQRQVDMAIVAGVNAIIDPRLMSTAAKAGMTSEEGTCKAFSEDANGYGRGEGAGVLLLKRLSDAKRDGDNILALISGSALNQDGQSSQLTAPKKSQQVAVINDALKVSGLEANDIDVIEAHGTGTTLGDRIETEALSQVFGRRPEKNRIMVRSVKSNIGHCEAAAGVASLIKIILSMQHAQVPGQARLSRLNPKLDLSALRIDKDLLPWKRNGDKPRRAGVSSYGFSGTNAHVVIEEAPLDTTTFAERLALQWRDLPGYPVPEQPSAIDKEHLLLLSSRSKNALDSLVRQYKVLLQKENWSIQQLANLAYTTAIGRTHHPHRVVITFASKDELITKLTEPEHNAKALDLSLDNPTNEQLDVIKHWYRQDAYLQSIVNCHLTEDEVLRLSALTANWAQTERSLNAFVLLFAAVKRYQHVGLPVHISQPGGIGKEVYDVIMGKKPIERALADIRSGKILMHHVNAKFNNIANGYSFFLDICARFYQQGGKINWVDFWKGHICQKIDLPLYPFQRQRYWYDSVLSIRPRGTHLSSSHHLNPVHLLDGELIYEHRIDLNDDSLSFLAGHRVGEQIVFPAAGYIDLILRATMPLHQEGSVNIESIQFQQMLILKEDSATICQIRLKPLDDEKSGYTVEFHAWSEHETVDKATNYVAAIIHFEPPSLQAVLNITKHKTPLSADNIYSRLNKLGLSYGVNWQLIRSGTVNDRQATIEFIPREEVLGNVSQVVTSLDAALHAAISLIDDSELPLGVGIVPNMFKNLVISEDISRTAYVIVNKEQLSNGFGFNIKFTDKYGNQLANLERYTIAKIKLRQVTNDGLANSSFKIEWQPHVLGHSLDSNSHLKANADYSQLEVALPTAEQLPRKDSAWLNNYSLIIFEMILVKRWPSLQKIDSIVNITQVESGKNPKGHFNVLLKKGFEYLSKAGLIKLEGDSAMVLHPFLSYSALQKKLEGISVDEGDIQQVFLQSVTHNIDRIIDGDMKPLEALFPYNAEPESFRHAEAVYQHAKDARMANIVVTRMVGALQAFASDKPIRILEIGAGTGGTTRALLAELKQFTNVHYIYTDLSPTFAKNCDACFAETGISHQFEVLDISKNPAEQGFASGQFDIIIATNVLHATRNIEQTMAHVQHLLVEGGVAVISETIENAAWLDLTFGLTPGWWAFNDRVRTNSPLLSQKQWEQVLHDVGMPCQYSQGDSQRVFLACSVEGPRPVLIPRSTFILPRHFIFGFDQSIQSIERLLQYLGHVGVAIDLSFEQELAPAISLVQSCDRPTVYFIADSMGILDQNMDAYQSRVAKPFFQLLQAMHARKATINLITISSQAAIGEKVFYPEQATLSGFLTSARAENHQWRVKAIDCEKSLLNNFDLATMVVKACTQATYDIEFAIRENQILVPRLTESPEFIDEPQEQDIQGVALITGGTGEVGQALVKHLAKMGHKKFALLSRREVSIPSLDEGLNIKVYQDDLSNLSKLEETWHEIKAGQGDITQVFHLAGTLADRSLKDMTWSDVKTVFKSKVMGTYHLHKQTIRYPVKQFVVFSSLASLLSTPQQMNHVAANRFMDSLVHMRRTSGLPAVSINWGFWSKIGSAARIKADVVGRRYGFLSLTPEQCFKALDYLLKANPSQGVVAKFDWITFLKQFSVQTVPPLFLNIAGSYKEILESKDELSASKFSWEAFVQGRPQKDGQIKMLADMILTMLRKQLRVKDTIEISTDAPLNAFPVAIDSFAGKEVVDDLNERLGWQGIDALTTNVFFSHETIDEIANTIWQQLAPSESKKVESQKPKIKKHVAKLDLNVNETETSDYSEDAVAIIGMSLRFPGANDADEYWHVLNSGFDPIIVGNPNRRGNKCYFGTVEEEKFEMDQAGFLSIDISQFDANFFNISEEEALVMDPQQRLLLQLVWEALEQAGIAPSSLKGTNTSVVMGIAANEFGDLLLQHSDEEGLSRFHASGNNPSATVGRISYQLGLQGANLAVNTACSSSLVSLDIAFRQIREGSADVAITGAVNLILSPRQMKLYKSNGMLSPTSHCHTFSDQADGMVRSEGCAVYILKLANRAQLDGDNILAVIEGTSINQNGASFSFMAPDISAQRALIRASLSVANIVPEQLDWIETHGTGTKLGDPVEAEALAEELSVDGKKLLLGAVKSNLGHAEAAAGAAGLSKIILALQRQYIPPNRFDGQLNPLLGNYASSISPVMSAMPWQEQEGKIRRALLSSFGFSGTNGQAVIAEPPQMLPSAQLRLLHQWQALQNTSSVWEPTAYPDEIELSSEHLFVVSSKSEDGLREQLSRLRTWLEIHPNIDEHALLERIAMTLSKGRDHFNYRVGIQAASGYELIEALDKQLEKSGFVASMKRPKNLAFLFTGQGSQYAEMGWDLYTNHPLYRAIFDYCCKLLEEHLSDDLTDIIFGSDAKALVAKTSYAQPALFVLEYALAQVLMAYGMQPDFVLGHSVGEYVAATLAGCMSLQDALKLISARGRIMERAPDGRMIAVASDAETVLVMLDKNGITLDIAGKNHSRQTILSGNADSVAAAIQIFRSQKIRVSTLPVNKAFHSRCMEPVLAEFREIANELTYHAPSDLTFISSLTGKQVTVALNADHWVDHLRYGVDFIGAVTTLDDLGVDQCCELGPKAVLLKMIKTILEPKVSRIVWYDALSSQKSDISQLHAILSQFYQLGGQVNWSNVWVGSLVRPIELPTYAFQNESYWPEVLGGEKRQSFKKEPAVINRAAKEIWSLGQKTIVKCLNIALRQTVVTSLDATFYDYGGSSLELPAFQESLYHATGLSFSMKDLEQASLRELVSRLPSEFKIVDVKSAQADEDSWYEPFPLNPIQFAYWIGRQGIIPLGHVSAHGYLEVKMTEVDIPRLQQALNQLIRQHHMLRVTISRQGVQRVQEKVPEYQIPLIDLSGQSEVTRDAQLSEIRDELSHQVKDASVWPLFDIRVTQIADNVYRLHLSFDSLIIDMYSMRLLFDEWYQLYTNSSYQLAPLTFTFRDYHNALEALKEQMQYKKAEAYWLKRVKTMPLGPDLPLKIDPAAVKNQKFARCNSVIPQEQWALIKEKARLLKVTPTNVLLTLFSIVLGRYSRRKRFLVNLTLFRRNHIHPDVKKLIGDFTNIEIFEADVTQAHSVGFGQLIRVSKDRLLEDLDHADFNGVDIQRALVAEHGLENHEAVAPIVFTSLLNLKLDRDSDEQKGDIVWQQFGDVEFSTTQTPQIWLDHKTFESSNGLVVEWDYVEALFGRDMMEQIHIDYIRYLEYLSHTDWALPLPDLVTERLMLNIQALNNTANPQYIGPETLVSLIDETKVSFSSYQSVFDESVALTHGEFCEQTIRIAAVLQTAGVTKGDFVAVNLDRNVNMLTAIVAVIRAGGVYLPVEPSLPAKRKEYMVDDSQAKLVLTDSANQDFWSDKTIHTILVETALVSKDPFTFVDVQPDDLAYLLYTSGTSGNPKGVMIEHRSVVNRLLWMQKDYHIGFSDVFIQKTPVSFDVSIWELFLPLISGASVFMPKPHGHKDIGYLKEVMSKYNVSRAHFVPSMLEIFLQAEQVMALPQLQTVFCSGEALLASQVNRFNSCYPEAQIVNFYGPTEATVDVTYWVAPKTEVSGVPIGKPAANVEVIILDSMGLPCPVGVTGELWLTGIQVARGYLNLLDKTAAAFVSNPYSSRFDTERAYRTGDLAYLNADGEIMYMGRMDGQVKIRGQRIELGEVQQGIGTLPMVKQVAVLPVKDKAERTSLVAFVVQDKVPSKEQMDVKLKGVISDKQARDEFTISNEGRLASERYSTTVKLFGDDVPEALFHRKSYRSYLGSGLTERSLTDLFNVQPNVASVESFTLASWLKAIAGFKCDEMVLPKYFYPSAGSLYPVKCYLAVGQNDDGIAPGYYYFDQIRHQLELCSDLDTSVGVGIHVALVAHKRMMAPLYGAFWHDFAAVEAGAMLELLTRQGQSMGIGLVQIPSEDWVSNLGFVVSEDVICGSWQIEPNTLTLKQSINLPMWLTVNDKVDGLNPGLYYWDGNRLELRAASAYPWHLLSDGDNTKMIAQSSAVAFFTALPGNKEATMAMGS